MDYCPQDFIPQQNLGNTQITVFYINDTHGNVTKVSKLKPAHDKFKKHNKKGGLTVGAGDLYLGGNKGRNSAMTKIYNALKLDYATAGNHEYDAGSAFYANNIKNAKFTTVVSNINLPAKNPLSERLQNKKLVKSDVFMKNGTRFAILGTSPSDKDIGTADKDNKVSVMTLDETIAVLNQEVEKLEAKGVNKIILLSHSGYDSDLQIATKTGGIDVIIGGHTHDALDGVNKEDNAKSKKNLVKSLRLEPVIITQAGSDNTNAGYLDVLFDKKGVLIEDKIQNKLVKLEKYPDSKKIDRILAKSLGKNEVIAPVTVPFLPSCEDDERKAENPVASILADGMLRRGQKYCVEVAFFNAPSMKSSGISGKITTYDIKYRMLPYDDDVVVAELNEKQFVDLLNTESKTIITKDLSQVLHCAGMKYTINKSDAKKDALCVHDVCILDKNGNVVRKIDTLNPDESKIVKCAMNKFLFKESTLASILKDVKTSPKVGNQQEIFIEQIKQKGELKAEKDGRLNVIE